MRKDSQDEMAIWPFGRKSKKSPLSAEDPARAATEKGPPQRAKTEPLQSIASAADIKSISRRSSKREGQSRTRSSSRKLSKSGGPTAIQPDDVIPPVPALPQEQSQQLSEKRGLNKSNIQADNRDEEDVIESSYYRQDPLSASSLQPEILHVVRETPTLHNKRPFHDQNQGLLRRKSSKRKKQDQEREREVKAMSSPIPIPRRPKSYQTDMLARDSRNIRGDLNRNLERPLSNVSLPLAESLHSQMSASFEQRAFKVGAFDALSPRPKIRGSTQSPYTSAGPSRSSTRKDKQPMIFESDEPLEKSRKRINELADDMDTSSLRELMERERRRLDVRRKSENEKLQRRLQRKAEHQRKHEAAAKDGHEHIAQDQPTVMLVDDPRPVPPESPILPKQDEGTRTPESWLRDPSREHLSLDPFRDPVVGMSRSHLEEATPVDEKEEPILETAKAIRMSSASMTPPPLSPSNKPFEPRHVHEPSSLSQYSELAPSTPAETPEPKDSLSRKDSNASARISSTWKSIFRRSDTRAKRGSADRGHLDRGRTTPSEFSNTSRESFSRQFPPSGVPRLPRVRSGTPIRTQSIFREDLPEFPVSPPGSRMQSPETTEYAMLPNIPGSRGTDTVPDAEKPLSEIHPAYREEVALSRNASLRARSPEEPQSATLSESLASVDAEGSWLTGRPVKRISTPQPLRESQQLENTEDSEDEGPGTPPAERYMGSLTPLVEKQQAESEPPEVPERRRPLMDPARGIGGDSDDENEAGPRSARGLIPHEEGTTLHHSPGKHPTIVQPSGPGPRVKSREGLLNYFETAEGIGNTATTEGQEDSSRSPSEHSPSSPEGPFIQRATSVDLGGKGHARHISAGSAKLLNLPSRNSMEIKRLSSTSTGSAGGDKSPLAQHSRVSEEIETHPDDVD